MRETTSLDVRRSDFKLDTLSPHHFMHFRVTDDNGRQRGAGRNLATLKAELGGQARGAFQALAALKLARPEPAPATAATAAAPARGSGDGRRTAVAPAPGATAALPVEPGVPERYRSWSFGSLPELLEIRRKGQTLIGFPALVT